MYTQHQRSLGEIKVHDILDSAGFSFAEEYSFSDLTSDRGYPLRFDFVVFDDNEDIDFLIEVQGEQHYRPVSVFGGAKGLYKQQRNDVKKRKYCLEHNYKLISIPYYDLPRVNLDYIMKSAGY